MKRIKYYILYHPNTEYHGRVCKSTGKHETMINIEIEDELGYYREPKIVPRTIIKRIPERLYDGIVQSTFQGDTERVKTLREEAYKLVEPRLIF